MRMNHARFTRRELLSGALACGAAVGATSAWGAPRSMFTAERTENWLLVKDRAGKPVLRYLRRRVAGENGPSVEGACYTHPIYTPSGELVTDLAPADHPHHRGVFCGWVELQGEKKGDWWGWGAKAPKEARLILNREATTADAGKRLTLRLVNSWRAENAAVLEEVLSITIGDGPDSRVIDYDYRFTPPTGTPVVIAQNPFGGFCYRALPRGKLVVSGPDGEVDLPNAVYNRAETNWPAARWYDLTYAAPDGKMNGVALINHPANPRSTWHVVRNIHMLNPCIVADAPLTISSGSPLRLRYRLVAHDGPANPSVLDRLAGEFAG